MPPLAADHRHLLERTFDVQLPHSRRIELLYQLSKDVNSRAPLALQKDEASALRKCQISNLKTVRRSLGHPLPAPIGFWSAVHTLKEQH